MVYSHIPVLLKEVIELLALKVGDNAIDATLGGGGYTKAILEIVGPGGKVLAIDLDPAAHENFSPARGKSQIPENLILHHGNFKNIDEITVHNHFFGVQAIVADIGFSSYQLDQSERGISFQNKELLDMRFDQKSTQTDARFMLNVWDAKRLEKIFSEFGEEKYSRAIANKIVDYRINNGEIQYTTELHQIVQDALPKPVRHKADDSARRIFQALRIAVNNELDNLREFLPKAFNILTPSGRLAVVSFHSLEDRIVKQYFQSLSRGCVCPIDFPQCLCGKMPQAKVLTKKPITASEEELAVNPRSRPAKLRVIQKI